MSYVLNKVLNNDIVGIINNEVVNSTIKTLREKCSNLLSKITILTDYNENLLDMYGTCKDELDTYKIGEVDFIVRKFDEEMITEWDDEGGDTGMGISFNKNTYKDFDDWYSDYKSDFVNWFVSGYKWDYGNLPNIWVFEAMTYEKENYGDSFISQTENYTKFLSLVLYLKIYEHLGEYDRENGRYANDFKNRMKDLYDSKETDTDSDTE